jgi:hypothetical protein
MFIPDPDPDQKIQVFLTQKTDTKFSKIKSGRFISGCRISALDFSHPGSRDKKRHRIPDPQHWVLFAYFKISKAINNDTFSGKHGPWS